MTKKPKIGASSRSALLPENGSEKGLAERSSAQRHWAHCGFRDFFRPTHDLTRGDDASRESGAVVRAQTACDRTERH